MKHVIAVFDGIDDGLRAVAALEREDLPLSRISLLARGAHADLPSNPVSLAFEEMSVLGTGAAMVTGLLAAVMRAAKASNPEIGTAKAERVVRVLSLCRPLERVSAA